jgi:hypothetical protein
MMILFRQSTLKKLAGAAARQRTTPEVRMTYVHVSRMTYVQTRSVSHVIGKVLTNIRPGAQPKTVQLTKKRTMDLSSNEGYSLNSDIHDKREHTGTL